MTFNPLKCAHLRFGADVDSLPYTICQTPIPQCTEQRDLGIIFNNSLSWSPHISSILAKAYKSLNLIRRVVPYDCDISFKRSLYLSLVRSHLTYCSSIWRPNLIRDSRRLEQIQRRASKFLVSSDLDYKTRLIVSNLLPLSLWLEAQDILLLIKMLNGPPDNFHLDDYIVVVSSNTRASTSNHLKRVQPTIPRLNSTKFFYFNRVVKIWNALPPLDLALPYTTIKKQILSIFWQYFLHTYDVDTPCT